MEERQTTYADPTESSMMSLQQEDSATQTEGYALYYPLVSQWEHPDGIRFDQPRD